MVTSKQLKNPNMGYSSDFVARLEIARDRVLASNDPDEINDIFCETLKSIGGLFCMGGVINLPSTDYEISILRLDDTARFRDDKVSWTDHLKSKRYVPQDSVITKASTHNQPFLWSTLRKELSNKALGQKIYNEAARWNLVEGLAIPVPVFY